MFESKYEIMVTVRDQCDTYIKYLELRPHGERTGVFATRRIPKGSILLKMQGDLLKSPNKFSIQVDTHKHLGKGNLIDDEMNHSCKANARIEFSDLTICAKYDIFPNEEVCINYCATEDVLAEPFNCDCGTPKCYGIVRGFKYLTSSQRADIEDDISPYIRKRYHIVVSKVPCHRHK